MNVHLLKSVRLALLLILVAMSRADGKTDDLSDLHEIKRQGLIPFPRVGRGDLKTSPMLAPWLLTDGYGFQKRNNIDGGMWFGPRLGRLQKRSFEDASNPWTLLAFKDPSFKQNDLVSRLASESEEDNDDTLVEEALSRRMDSKTRNNISQQ